MRQTLYETEAINAKRKRRIFSEGSLCILIKDLKTDCPANTRKQFGIYRCVHHGNWISFKSCISASAQGRCHDCRWVLTQR